MPVYKKKQACTQADGDKGTYTLYHKLKSGKEEKVGCSTSKKKAQSYVKGSYADWKWDKNNNKKNENITVEEKILHRLLEMSVKSERYEENYSSSSNNINDQQKSDLLNLLFNTDTSDLKELDYYNWKIELLKNIMLLNRNNTLNSFITIDLTNYFKIKDLTDNQIFNLAQFGISIPYEMLIFLWTQLSKCKNNNNLIKFHKIIGNRIINIINGKNPTLSREDEGFIEKLRYNSASPDIRQKRHADLYRSLANIDQTLGSNKSSSPWWKFW
jgi:hypothetical protein